MITGQQCAAARALVEITRAQLAERTGIPEQAVRDFEDGAAVPEEDAIRLLRSLEELGAVFISEDETMGAGVRLKFSRSVTRRLAVLENEGGPIRSDDVP